MAAPHKHYHLYHPLRTGRLFAVPALGLALLAAACGVETAPGSLGTDTVPVTVAPPTTPPPETTTTIDFSGPNDQVTTPLGEESTAAEVAEISDNIRGLTANSSAQMNRVGPFVTLISASTAKILDFGVSIERGEATDFQATVTMSALAPDPSSILAANIHDELRANGWNRAVQDSQAVEAGERLTGSYGVPGKRASDLELTVEVTDAGGVTELELTYVTTEEDNDVAFEHLIAWQADLPVPRAAVATSASLSTADDEGTIAVVYEVTADSVAEARATMLGRLDGGDFALDAGTDTDEGSTEPLLVTDEDGTSIELAFSSSTAADTVDMTVSNTFALSPVE